MDFQFNDDEQMVHDMCSRFAKEALAAAGAEADRNSSAAAELIASAVELGLFIDAVPAAQEGYLEGDYNHRLRAVRSVALASGCPALTMRFEANTEFALASDKMGFEQGIKALGEAPGEIFACTALESELKPLFAKDGKISGGINAVPNAVGAAWYLLVSVASATEPFVAIVDAKTKGFKVEAQDTMALRAAEMGNISLKQVAPTKMVTGKEAVDLIAYIRSSYRVLAASLAVGSALQAIYYAEEYAAERIQFGQPIGKFQSLSRMVQENRSRLEAARFLTFAAADALDSGKGYEERCKQAADCAGQFATLAAIDAVQIYGGYGYVNDYPVEKIMRDARACTTLAGDALQEMVFDKCI